MAWYDLNLESSLQWYYSVQMVYKWCTNGVQMVDKWCTNGVQLVYKWCTNGVQMVYKWCTNTNNYMYIMHNFMMDFLKPFSYTRMTK